MKILLRTLALPLAAVLLFSSAVPAPKTSETPADTVPEGCIGSLPVSAESAILIEAKTGTALYEKEADERLPMASTTKIMTALVALELAPPETVVTVPREAVGTEGSSVYLFEEEQLTLEQLLYALLLASANDAAVAIACGTAGSVEAFAGKMNEKAASLGLRNTHFVNPHGLDDPDHYTSARDLAVIARAALEVPLIRKAVSTQKITIPHNAEDGVRLLVNHNKLLRMYDGAIGVKTGFTKRSGRCLVSAAERDGVTLIAVTLRAPDDWNDHRLLLDSGFAAVESVILCDDGSCRRSVPVVGGTVTEITVANPSGLRVLLPSDHGEITSSVELPRFLYAPVPEGKTVGQVVFRCDGRTVGTVPLITEDCAEKPERAGFFRRLLDRLFRKK